MINDILPFGDGLSDKVYNFLKWVTLILLPALATLYFTLSASFDLPNVEGVMGALAAAATFLGAILGISSKNYEEHTDGDIVKTFDPDSGKTIVGLELNEDASVIGAKDRLVLTVKDTNDPFWDR